MWLIIPSAPLRTQCNLVHKSTLTRMQGSERDFGGAKWEESKLRGQMPGFKCGHYLLDLWPVGSHLSLFVGDYAYRDVFGIWWTRLMGTIMNYYAKPRRYSNHYNDFLKNSVLVWVMWPFCNLLNDISFRLIYKWDYVPGLLMLVRGEAEECKASRGSSSKVKPWQGRVPGVAEGNCSQIENPWVNSV